MCLVTISKVLSSSLDFRGFLCQVRQVGQTDAVGNFAVRDTSKARTLDCTTELVSFIRMYVSLMVIITDLD